MNILWCDAQHISLYCSCLLYLRFSPPSEHSRSSLDVWLLTNFFRWESSSAFHNSSSLYFSKGSRFIRRVPENRTGSYKHISITVRRKTYITKTLFYLSSTSISNLWTVNELQHFSQKGEMRLRTENKQQEKSPMFIIWTRANRPLAYNRLISQRWVSRWCFGIKITINCFLALNGEMSFFWVPC